MQKEKLQNKIKLIFEGSVLTNGIKMDSARSGIFFVTLNILSQFLKSEDIDVCLFLPFSTKKEVEELKIKNIIPKDCEIILKDILIPNYFLSILKICDKQNDNILKKIVRFTIFRLKKLVYIIQILLLSLKILTGSYDVYFSTINNIPCAIRRIKKIKKYMVIHDLIPLIMKEFYAKYGISRMKQMSSVLNSLDEKINYFAVSDSTRNDLLNHNKKIPPQNVVTAYIALDKTSTDFSTVSIEQVKKKYNIPDCKYVLSLCSIEPRKNIVFGMKNFMDFIKESRIEDLVFVQAGGIWAEYEEQFERFYSSIPKGKIINIGYVEDEDKPSLYAGALMFYGASLYEGFGLPILEAMQYGTPVITSNTSSLIEIAEDAGLIIDPTNDKELQNAYKTLYYNESLRNELKEKGRKRAEMFSWEKTGDEIIKKIKQDLGYENII